MGHLAKKRWEIKAALLELANLMGMHSCTPELPTCMVQAKHTNILFLGVKSVKFTMCCISIA